VIRKVFFLIGYCVHSNRSVCAPDVSPALHKACVMDAVISSRIVERVSIELNNGLESIASTRSMILPIFLEIAFFCELLNDSLNRPWKIRTNYAPILLLLLLLSSVFVIREHILCILNNSENTKLFLGTFTLKLFCVRECCRYYLSYEIASEMYSTASEPDLAQPLNFGFVFRIYSSAQWVKTPGTINMVAAVGPKPNIRKAFL